MALSRNQRIGTAIGLATAIAIPAEGLRQWAYRDPGPAIWTICWGSTKDVSPGQFATLEECRARLTVEMLDAIETVEKCVPGLPAHQLAAFADAVFNIGPRIVCDRATSTAARLLAAGDVEAACEQLPRWNRATVGGVSVELPGLTKRRARERALCLYGDIG
jgi:lysozyme